MNVASEIVARPEVGAAAAAVAAMLVTGAVIGWLVPLHRRPGLDATPERTVGRASALRWLHPRRRSQHAFTPALAARWLDDVARSTRSGRSLRDAVTDPATVDDETESSRPDLDAAEPLRRSLRRGAPISEAVTSWHRSATRHGDVMAAVGTALIVADQVGGSVAIPLERAAASLRARLAEDDERHAQAAQARLSAQLLAGLPIAILVLLAVSDPDVIDVLRSPIGGGLVAVGLALDATGLWWMRRIVRSAS